MLPTRLRLKFNIFLLITIRQLQAFPLNHFIKISMPQVLFTIFDFPLIRLIILIINGLNDLVFELFGEIMLMTLGLFIYMENGTDFVFDAFINFGCNGLLLVGMDHASLHLNFGVLFFHYH